VTGGQGRVGIDVGGTFTDVFYADDRRSLRAKVPTDPNDFAAGILDGLARIATSAGSTTERLLAGLGTFGLGTTAVTNVVTALTGARVGLITTAGFTDELKLARGIRPSGDGRVTAPFEIVPRARIRACTERIASDGAVVRALRDQEVEEAGRELADEHRVEAIVVSFVNAYRNPGHEQRAAEILRHAHPNVLVLTGVELAPAFGFFQRTFFAVLNAFSASSIDGIDKLARKLKATGLTTPMRVVNSTGGTTGVDAARRRPMTLMHSGPAGGVAAAADVARCAGLLNAIACDMGGTSFDVSVVSQGTASRELHAEVLGQPTPLAIVDVESIGSGGGSIGWIDSRGMLRVGPRSARATPGPACYRRGGTEPTVTDALLCLGYIDRDRFIGGAMRLDTDAAIRACSRLGDQLGMTALEVASGIRELALSDMTRAVRLICNRRGLDVRQHGIVSYGGCGGLFTAEIAQALGMSTVLVPHVASVLSAYGAAWAPVRHEREQAVVHPLPVDDELLHSILFTLTEAVGTALATDGIAPADHRITYEADVRFRRQKFEITVPFDGVMRRSHLSSSLRAPFLAEYGQRYGAGSILRGAPLELVTLRAVGGTSHSTATRKPDRGGIEPAPHPAAPARTRTVVLSSGAMTVPVFDGDALESGARIHGPACIDKQDTTIWLPEGTAGVVGDERVLLVSVASVEGSASAA